MLLFSDLGIWGHLRDEEMSDIRLIVQTDREAFTDLISASVLPNFTSSLLRGRVSPPMDRVELPILDEKASITFWLCGLRKQKRLMDSIPPIT